MPISKRVAAAVFIGLLALTVRLPGLGSFMTADEENWMLRSKGFYHSLFVNHDPGGTFMTTHPGATAMWLIGAGLQIQDSRLGATLPIAFATSVLIGIATWFLIRLFGLWPGIFAGFLLAVEPYLIGMSQIAHLDMLLAMLMLNAVLVFLLHLQGVPRSYTLEVSVGVLAGLAMATKLLPALWLLVFFALFLLWKYKLQVHEVIRRLGFIVGVVALVFFAAWPTLWVQSDTARSFKQDLPSIVQDAHVEVEESQEPIAPGSFYVRTVLARTTPFVLILVVGSMFARKQLHVFWLLLYAAGFLVFITLAAKKADRYALPALVMLPVLAGLHLRGVKWVLAPVAVLLLAQVWLWSPYAIAYNNPLFHVRTLSQQGWGEGLDKAAEWLNTQPDVENLYIASWYPAVIRNFFRGNTLSLSSRNDERVGFAVLYRNMFGRGSEDAATTVIEEFQNRKPVYVVEVQDVPYVWVYDIRGLHYFPNHIGELFGEKTVGQIVPVEIDNWSSIEIGLATFSSRRNTQDLILRVRESLESSSDLRTARVNATDIQDSFYHRFDFEQIPDSAGKSFYVFLESPISRPGDAITVRFSNHDLLPGDMVKDGKLLPGRDVAWRIPK